jgi:hypothetical protein
MDMSNILEYWFARRRSAERRGHGLFFGGNGKSSDHPDFEALTSHSSKADPDI